MEQPRIREVSVIGDGYALKVHWVDGKSDDAAMESDTLWRLAREQAGDIMTKAAFREWRRRNGLSLSGAAEALGLSRRQIAYYDSGEKDIPKHVLLACVGYEARLVVTTETPAGNSLLDATECRALAKVAGGV